MVKVQASAAILLLAIIALVGVLSATMASAGGTTYVVTKTEDTADGTCDADCSLREAVIASNNSGGTDTIVLGVGTYSLSILGAGENLAATGDLDVTDDLIIDGVSSDQTIIDGDANDTVFDLKEGHTVTIKDVTIRGGGDENSTEAGTGGIYSRASLTLERVVVTDNHFGGDDSTGGITSRGPLTLIYTRVIDNSAGGDASAGGIFADGVTHIYSSNVSSNSAENGGIGGLWFAGPTLTIDNSLFSFNQGSENGAGGLYAFEGTATITRSTFRDNVASDGVGGIWSEDAQFNISDSKITGNSASNSNAVGGLLLLSSDATLLRTSISENSVLGVFSVGGLWSEDNTLTFTDSDVTNNEATGESSIAGIYLFDSMTDIDRVDIYANSAQGDFSVGGIFVDTGSSANAVAVPAGQITYDTDIHDSEITDNSAELAGLGIAAGQAVKLDRVTISENDGTDFGGIWNDGYLAAFNTTVSENTAGAGGVAGIFVLPGALAAFYSSTIADNTSGGGADSAGGIWVDGDTYFQWSIIAYNSEQNCVLGSGTLYSFGGNFEENDTCDFNHATDHPNTDPLLDFLGDNGGWVPTQALASNSPAIDDADCDYDVDARGAIRPSGFCDAGAYEYNAEPAAQSLVWGDNNCSFSADMYDAILDILTQAGLTADTGHCPEMGEDVQVAGFSTQKWGDMDCDGLLTGADSILIISYYTGSPQSVSGCPTVGTTVMVTRESLP